MSAQENCDVGVQLFDQKFICALNEVGLTHLQGQHGAFCKIVDAYQDAYLVLFILDQIILAFV